jgi:hypothetical protein
MEDLAGIDSSIVSVIIPVANLIVGLLPLVSPSFGAHIARSQKQIPFNFAQGRLSTHRPPLKYVWGPFAQDDSFGFDKNFSDRAPGVIPIRFFNDC